MELCDRSLADRLKEALEQRLPGIPPKELLKYVRGAADGLDALADHNVQHRDVKPGNLLLLHKGVKVADFGLAKLLDQSISTKSGAYSPAYTAPESIKGTIARQSDQYSLAMTYYHLRTGQLLFSGTCDHILYCHTQEQPNLTALPPAEQVVVARALAKDPEKRWKNCATFVNELIKGYNLKPVPLAKVAPQQEGQRLPKEAELLAQATILPASAEKRPQLWPLAVAASLTLLVSLLIVMFLITSLAPDMIARVVGGETARLRVRDRCRAIRGRHLQFAGSARWETGGDRVGVRMEAELVAAAVANAVHAARRRTARPLARSGNRRGHSCIMFRIWKAVRAIRY